MALIRQKRAASSRFDAYQRATTCGTARVREVFIRRTGETIHSDARSLGFLIAPLQQDGG
jgi:hypothetical protein